jgi:hypothetical protein
MLIDVCEIFPTPNSTLELVALLVALVFELA